MNLIMKQDIKIVRNRHKMTISDLAKKVGVSENEVRERIDFLYSAEGRKRLEHAERSIKRENTQARVRRRRIEAMRLEVTGAPTYSCKAKLANELIALPPRATRPIKQQHIDTSYIKGSFQAEYTKMRQRERRSNDTARDIFIST